MYIIDELSKVIFYLALIITATSFIKFTFLLIKLMKNINITHKNLKRWKQGITSLSDIHSLTPKEFEFWCGEFFYNHGYSKIEQMPLGPDEGKDIICLYSNEKTYIECKRYIFSTTAKFIVDVQICKKLVGAMVHDNVLRGIIVTSGIISKECENYIKSLPQKYHIELYDGERIVKEYTRLHTLQKSEIA